MHSVKIYSQQKKHGEFIFTVLFKIIFIKLLLIIQYRIPAIYTLMPAADPQRRCGMGFVILKFRQGGNNQLFLVSFNILFQVQAGSCVTGISATGWLRTCASNCSGRSSGKIT